MGFSTLADEDCQIRKPLTKFKWADVTEIANGQTIKNKNLIELAVTEAKDARLKDPYVKVGQVKKDLIFRIKHKGGHWGEDDIVVISNYTHPVVEVDVKGGGDGDKRLLPIGGVNSDWFRNFGSQVPKVDALIAALGQWDQILPIIQGVNAKTDDFDRAADVVDSMQDAARAVMQNLTHPDDRKEMLKYIGKARNLEDQVEKNRENYLSGQTKGLHLAADLFYTQTVIPDVEKTRKEVTEFAREIKDGKLDEANRRSAKLAKFFMTKFSTDDSRIAEGSAGCADEFNVDRKGLVEHILGESRRKDWHKQYESLGSNFEKLNDMLESAEARQLDHEYDHPEDTPNTDPVYRQHLAEINRDFKDVLQSVTGAYTTASQAIGRAKALATAVAKKNVPNDFMAQVQGLLDDFATLKRDTITEYEKIRTGEGSVKQKEALYKIELADKVKFTVPVLNRVMGGWYRYRGAESEAKKYLLGALTFYVKANPDDNNAMDTLQTLKTQLAREND